MNKSQAEATFTGRDYNVSVVDYLLRAKRALNQGEAHLRAAAEHIAAAHALGASQRAIAAGIGKSAPWVNRLLRWREGGYRDETPFGPQSKASRQRRASRDQPPEHETGPHNPYDPIVEAERLRAAANKAAHKRAHAEAQKAKADAARAKSEATKAKAEAERAKAEAQKAAKEAARASKPRTVHCELSEQSRSRLVKCLGMLGSEHAGERDNAAQAVEKIRRSFELTWEDLIIPASD